MSKKKTQKEGNQSTSSSDQELSLVSSSSGSDASISIEEKSWISWYCSVRGHEFFVEVDKTWIEDDFNLYGLSGTGVQHYDFALDMILDREIEYELNEQQSEVVQRSADKLYGLIHARFIVTQRGLELMKQKYLNVDFGRCPRVFCEGQPVLPVGQSDLSRNSLAKLLCPRCQEIYYPPFPKHSQIDGAYFGTTFAHLFLQVYPDLIPSSPKTSYVPRIFGFKIHHSSRKVLLEEVQKRKKNNIDGNNSEDVVMGNTNASDPLCQANGDNTFNNFSNNTDPKT